VNGRHRRLRRAAVHAGFDFVWQVPAVPLTQAALVGPAIPPATWTDQAA
jgi:hypothetical protein